MIDLKAEIEVKWLRELADLTEQRAKTPDSIDIGRFNELVRVVAVSILQYQNISEKVAGMLVELAYEIGR